MFVLRFETDNAAFADEDGADECARILRDIANKLDSWDGYDKFQTVYDQNGNDECDMSNDCHAQVTLKQRGIVIGAILKRGPRGRKRFIVLGLYRDYMSAKLIPLDSKIGKLIADYCKEHGRDGEPPCSARAAEQAAKEVYADDLAGMVVDGYLHECYRPEAQLKTEQSCVT